MVGVWEHSAVEVVDDRVQHVERIPLAFPAPETIPVLHKRVFEVDRARAV